MDVLDLSEIQLQIKIPKFWCLLKMKGFDSVTNI